jgi:NAD(P)H-nitrite reductase large subunit
MLKSIISKFIKQKAENKGENSRIICGCYKVTEQDLKNAIKNGAKSFKEVQAVTKVGTGCGRCVGSNKVLVNELLLNKKIEENPVVCGCLKVTVQDLAKAIKNGAKSFEEVQAVTKVGTGCGKCVESNKVLVNQLLARKKIEENQVVCGCFKVTAQDIVNAVKNGAKSFEEVQAVTKVGTGCGKCIESNKAFVAQLLAEK